MASPFSEPGSDATFDLSLWSGTGGTVSSTTAQFHTGTHSIEVLSTSTGNFNRHGCLADAGRRVSFWLRFDTVPASTDAIFCSLASSGGAADIILLYITSAGKVKNGPVGATAVTGTAVLAVNTWYQICACYSITNTTTYSCKIYVNGVLDSTTNAGTLTGTGTADLYLACDANFGTTKKCWFDDIYIDDTSDGSYPGAVLVTYKRPNANGTTNGFTTQIGSGGSGYGTGHSPQVNEQPLSQTNGWSMVGAGSAVTEEYNVEGSTVGEVNLTGATIKSVMGWVFAKALANETASIVVDGTSSAVVPLTSTPLAFVKESPNPTALPAGTGKDIGLVTTTALTTVSLYECGIVVAYTAAASTVINRRLALLGVGP
jgi:hypothetical protein